MHDTQVLVGFTRRSDSARQVADLVRSDIVTNHFNGSLPYEWDLMSTYGATRNVIRDAMSILQGQNLLRRVPGSGTFTLAPGTSFSVDRKESRVKVTLEPGPDGPQDSHYAETLVSGYPEGRYRCLNAAVGQAPAGVARRLEIAADARVLYVEIVISHHHERQRLRSSWIPLERVPGIAAEPLDCFIPDLVARLVGQPTYSRNMFFEAVNADTSTAELLGIPALGAILMTERLNCVAGDIPVEYGFTRHRGDRTLITSNL